MENWLRAEVAGFVPGRDWYVGRPLIVTENDYGLQLFNGDTGVVMEGADGRLVAAFERSGAVAQVSPTRLAAVDSVYAMTVHKSQGSQFGAVAFLLPSLDSRVLTRELLYTAVTRARERLILVGPERSIRAAVDRPITRASGLGHGPLGRRRLTRLTRRSALGRNLPPCGFPPFVGCRPKIIPGLTGIAGSSQPGFRVVEDDEADMTP